MCLVSIAGASREPRTIVVPETSTSQGIDVAGVWVRFAAEQRGVRVEFEGLTTEQQRRGWVSVDALERRPFVVDTAAGEKWKCISQDDLPPIRVDLVGPPERWPLGLASWSEGRQVVEVPIRRWSTATVDTLDVIVSLPGGDEHLSVRLRRPMSLGAGWAMVLQRAERLGPAYLELSSHRLRPSLRWIGKDHCGDPRLFDLSFSEPVALGFPTPETRLLSIGPWLMVERIDPTKTVGPVPGDDFLNVMLLPPTYFVHRVGHRVGPAHATVVFLQGDFSHCFGAGCGDPVNLRQIEIEWNKGRFSSRDLGRCEAFDQCVL